MKLTIYLVAKLPCGKEKTIQPYKQERKTAVTAQLLNKIISPDVFVFFRLFVFVGFILFCVMVSFFVTSGWPCYKVMNKALLKQPFEEITLKPF